VIDLLPDLAARILPDVASRGQGRHIYLTFDDGPDPDITPQLLDHLGHASVRAAFFLTGRQVERHPDIARRIIREGHILGSHGYDHRPLTFASPGRAGADLDRADAAIRQATGFCPFLYRPPYGRIGPGVYRAARLRERRIVLWRYAPGDWKPLGRELLAARLLRNVGPGDIVLLHDRGAGVGDLIAALPEVLAEWQRRGMTFTALP